MNPPSTNRDENDSIPASRESIHRLLAMPSARRFLLGAILFGSALFGPLAGARAGTPVVSRVTPPGARRGTTVEVNLSGRRLEKVKEVLLYYPGIEIVSLEAVRDNLVKARFKIAPDCRLGEHALRLRTARGISELRTFWVGALRHRPEKEPNNDLRHAEPVRLDVTVCGVITSEDVDCFRFRAGKGQRVTAEVEGMRLATVLFDPHLAILDARGFVLAAADDTPLLHQDAVASVIIPADGDYFVQVRDSAFGGARAARYRLHLGSFPRPLAAFPPGGPPGETVRIRFLGDAAGEIARTITLPRPGAGPLRYGLAVRDPGGLSPSPVPFRLSALANRFETEPNDSVKQATEVTVPAALNGVLAGPRDIDYYRFPAKKNRDLDVRVFARRLRSPVDSVIGVCTDAGKVLVQNDDARGPDSRLRFRAPRDGHYCLFVRDQLRRGGVSFTYRVEISPPRPGLTLSIPKFARMGQEGQAVAVPQGNRFATLIRARRENFGGPLTLEAGALPAGVRVHAGVMAPNVDRMPVVFEAEPGAPVSGRLVPFTARHADPRRKAISGGLRQVSELLWGRPNNALYWSHETDRLAVAVTEPVDFSVRLEPPRAPLVQNGRLRLKVRVERRNGFNRPVMIRMLYNPPGVGSSGSVTIPGDQVAGAIDVNANGRAALGKWKIAVVARSTVDKGPLWVSTRLAEIEVQRPFVTLGFQRAVVEQGKVARLVCQVNRQRPFSGEARAWLVGVPRGAKAREVRFGPDAKEIVFPVTTTSGTRPGRYRNIYGRVECPVGGAPVLHRTGRADLRIDRPRSEAAGAPKGVPSAADDRDAKKRLSRLEELRQVRKSKGEDGP